MLNDIKKLEVGKQQEVQIIIKSAESATTRNGDRYQKLIVRDNNDHEALFFNFKEEIVGNFPFVVKALTKLFGIIDTIIFNGLDPVVPC